jgi:hypothetical protein
VHCTTLIFVQKMLQQFFNAASRFGLLAYAMMRALGRLEHAVLEQQEDSVLLNVE